MEGFIKHAINNAGDSLEKSVHTVVGKEVSKIRDIEGLNAAVNEFFEKSRVKIANHPGGFDGPLILKTLLRDDVKVVMNSDNYAVFAPIFGAQHIIEARIHDIL